MKFTGIILFIALNCHAALGGSLLPYEFVVEHLDRIQTEANLFLPTLATRYSEIMKPINNRIIGFAKKFQVKLDEYKSSEYNETVNYAHQKAGDKTTRMCISEAPAIRFSLDALDVCLPMPESYKDRIMAIDSLIQSVREKIDSLRKEAKDYNKIQDGTAHFYHFSELSYETDELERKDMTKIRELGEELLLEFQENMESSQGNLSCDLDALAKSSKSVYENILQEQQEKLKTCIEN